MSRMKRSAAWGAAAALVTGGLAAATTTGAQAAPDDVEIIQVLGINDFHGRIKANQTEAGAAVVAGAVKELRTENPNTVFAAAGDLIGASTFESFINHDKPTIDALNAAGLDVSAVGNHEFDQGFDDLVNRVMAPYDATSNPFGGATWEYVGANVKMKADGTQAAGLDPSWVQTFNAGSADEVQVGFIGAVTEHLDELVSPDGIADIEAVDIPTAVNAEADALVADGVDIVVLLVHEGASSTDIADATDPDSDFGKIVNGVDADVDAIISGHTHLAYNHTIADRPVVSAGQYGYNLNQLEFHYDTAADEIVSVDQAILPLVTKVDPVPPSKDPTYVPNYPADEPVGKLVDAAVKDADVKGSVKIGEVAAPFKRASRVSGAENRGGESTLGNLVAEVQRAQTPDNLGGAEIAFMNPGGLRADMVGTDGELSYKDAAVVQPFANTLVRMDLTGAQIRSALEQQWQPEGASRPFLRLGISAGFTYTYDPEGDTGNHVTSMWLDGEPIDDATSYSVTVNSFLATGGDNFSVLAEGTNKQDTGVTDLQAMVDYMAAADGPVSPDYTQRSVGVRSDFGSFAPGDSALLSLSSLSFSASGDVHDAEMQVLVDGEEVGSYPVTTVADEAAFDERGTAMVEFPVPADAVPGTVLTARVVGTTTGTTAEVRATVGTPTTTSVTSSADATTVGGDPLLLTASVSDADGPYDGDVVFFVDGVPAGSAATTDGTATFEVGPFLTAGTHQVTARLVGDEVVGSSSASTTVEVAKASASVTAKVKPKKVKAKKTKAKVKITVTADGVTPTGKVKVRANGKTRTVTLNKAGKVTVKLGKFKKKGKRKVVITYLGDDNTKKRKKTIKVKVVK